MILPITEADRKVWEEYFRAVPQSRAKNTGTVLFALCAAWVQDLFGRFKVCR